MIGAPIGLELLATYQAALQGCVFRRLDGAGYLALGGDTRLDYLQRQTSNDIRLLSATRAVPTVLTAPTGRIIEIFTVLEQADACALLTPPGRGPALAAYFQKRIFFNDLVTIEDHSPDWNQIELHGPEAPRLLAALGLERAPQLDEVRGLVWQGHPLGVLGVAGLAGGGFWLITPAAATAALEAALVELQALALDDQTAEILRLEAGLPGVNELTGEYTPFEVGLAARVSDVKGCYTGQEVLARQVTYDKITRGLAVLECEVLAEPGSSVLADGKTVGVISSMALSPQQGPLAMAVLRRPHHESGNLLSIQANSGTIPAQAR